MRKYRSLTVATIAFGGAALVGGWNLLAKDMDATTKPSTMPSGGRVSLPEGITPKELNEAKDINKQLAKLTNAFLSNNGFSDLVSYFVTYDRDRLKDYASKHDADMNRMIASFKADWRSKFGHDFDISDAGLAFPNDKLAVIQGEITNPTMLSNWPVDPTAYTQVPKEPSGDEHSQKLDKGRNVAIVQFNEEWGLPAINVSMIHEAIDSWRVDVPDNLTGEKLDQNLKEHLFAIGQMRDKWPTNVNDASRLVAHHLAMALYDVQMPKMHDMHGGGMHGGGIGGDMK